MNKRTIYTLPKGSKITGSVVARLIKAHSYDRDTFTKLESYVDDNPMISREPPNELLTINNFANYITNINTGYLIGNPVDYNSKDNTNIDLIIQHYADQSMYELDADLETDCSMFGQAFENVFLDEASTVTSAKLSVYNTIVVYDNTFKHDKMFAIYYSPMLDDKGAVLPDRYDLTIWDDTTITQATLYKENLTETEVTEHYIGEVPVVHYMNNKRLKGDYEPVISLIDAYNILQSDRVIDREKLVDAILAFYGTKLTAEDQKAIKDNRVAGLPEGAKAEYIVKQVNEADADVLRNTIAADIHKFSMTPDLTDETFGNNPSGVSILYKLLAFEQNIKSKERQFSAALKDRFRMYATAMVKKSLMTAIDASRVDVVFSHSLPKNDMETSQMINNLEGLVSQETLIGQLSFVFDASAEMEKVASEQDAKLKTDGFGTNLFTKTPASSGV